MLARLRWPGLPGLALLLAARTSGGQPVAGSLAVTEAIVGEGCPAPGWFEARLRQRGLQGVVRVVIGPGPDAGSFTGEITAQGRPGEALRRRLSGPRCATVAEGLVLVAEVHLPGPPAPPASSSPALPLSSSPTPSLSSSALALAPPPPPPASARSLHGALGAYGSVDTTLSASAAWGGGVVGWLTVGPSLLRGAGLSVGYSRVAAAASVPLDLQRLGARLDVVPVALALGADTALGANVALSGGFLRASADVSVSDASGRSLWLVDAGPRLRRRVGPLLVDLDLAASLALTRRRFTVTGLDAPVATLPRAALTASLAVLVSIP